MAPGKSENICFMFGQVFFFFFFSFVLGLRNISVVFPVGGKLSRSLNQLGRARSGAMKFVAMRRNKMVR